MSPRAKTFLVVIMVALAGCSSKRVKATRVSPAYKEAAGPRVLCIFAHPDDETTVAGTLFKTATFLDGMCDIALITNGEGGFKYSTLAETFYDVELTDEINGRKWLPGIRRDEFLEGCQWIGVTRAYFLKQVDNRYSTNPLEVIGPDTGLWEVSKVIAQLSEILERGYYDFVLTMAPSATTHGHHQAATILAQRAVAMLPADSRPVLLGVRVETEESGVPAHPTALEGFPETAMSDVPAFVFDRTERFGHREALDYRIIVNWVIASHKSQGTMQLAMNDGLREYYFLFASNPANATALAKTWFERLKAPQFEPRTYTESAGTNAGN